MLTGQVAIDMAKSVEDLACCDSQRGQISGAVGSRLTVRVGKYQADRPHCQEPLTWSDLALAMGDYVSL